MIFSENRFALFRIMLQAPRNDDRAVRALTAGMSAKAHVPA
jgi:hypothetical protein